jgi:hypothetical protein
VNERRDSIWPHARAACRKGRRSLVLGSRASARAEVDQPVWHHRVGTEGARTLEGKQSPWKDRVAGRWQRRLVTTDSSAEQSLEVGCSVRCRRALTPAHLGGCRRSATEGPVISVAGRAAAFGRLAGSLSRDPREYANSSGGPIAPVTVGASASAPTGRFHATRKGASAPIRVVCSMTWGSASADRSIIASTPLPRTPVPPPERAGLPASRGRATGAYL